MTYPDFSNLFTTFAHDSAEVSDNSFFMSSFVIPLGLLFANSSKRLSITLLLVLAIVKYQRVIFMGLGSVNVRAVSEKTYRFSGKYKIYKRLI